MPVDGRWLAAGLMLLAGPVPADEALDAEFLEFLAAWDEMCAECAGDEPDREAVEGRTDIDDADEDEAAATPPDESE